MLAVVSASNLLEALGTTTKLVQLCNKLLHKSLVWKRRRIRPKYFRLRG
jgi:hypothetical protein